MSAVPGRDRPRLSRSTQRVAAMLLALPLVATPLATATAAANPTSGPVGVHASVAAASKQAGGKTWGLRPHAAWSTRLIKHRYSVRTIYGYRTSSTSDHGKGLAADFMVYRHSAKGTRIAQFARAHHRVLNITYVIWNQRIWSVQRGREGWRRMSDEGSRTANHKNHVHISFRRTPNNFAFRH